MWSLLNRSRKIWFALSLVLMLTLSSLVTAHSALACDQSCDKNNQSEDDYLECIKDEQLCWQSKLDEARSQKASLQSTLDILNGQIAVQELEIEKTQTELRILNRQITELGDRLDGLEVSLDELTAVLIKRIQTTYRQQSNKAGPLRVLASQFNRFLTNQKYLQHTQDEVAQQLAQVEQQRANYDQQKQLKQSVQSQITLKNLQLAAQQQELANQRGGVQVTLNETQNNEQEYQRQLAQLQSELESIQAIISGRGNESAVGSIEEGERIATVIQGGSCNSSGTHLDFMVTDNNGVVKNPFNFLTNDVDYINCSGYGANGCFAGDPFNPSGDWPWPLNGTIQLNQGHGNTWAVRNTWVSRIYSYHSGIDLVADDLSVRAVADGELYRGSFTGSGGCRLRYVKVEHEDDDLWTYYLHVNY